MLRPFLFTLVAVVLSPDPACAYELLFHGCGAESGPTPLQEDFIARREQMASEEEPSAVSTVAEFLGARSGSRPTLAWLKLTRSFRRELHWHEAMLFITSTVPLKAKHRTVNTDLYAYIMQSAISTIVAVHDAPGNPLIETPNSARDYRIENVHSYSGICQVRFRALPGRQFLERSEVWKIMENIGNLNVKGDAGTLGAEKASTDDASETQEEAAVINHLQDEVVTTIVGQAIAVSAQKTANSILKQAFCKPCAFAESVMRLYWYLQLDERVLKCVLEIAKEEILEPLLASTEGKDANSVAELLRIHFKRLQKKYPRTLPEKAAKEKKPKANFCELFGGDQETPSEAVASHNFLLSNLAEDLALQWLSIVSILTSDFRSSLPHFSNWSVMGILRGLKTKGGLHLLEKPWIEPRNELSSNAALSQLSSIVLKSLDLSTPHNNVERLPIRRVDALVSGAVSIGLEDLLVPFSKCVTSSAFYNDNTSNWADYWLSSLPRTRLLITILISYAQCMSRIDHEVGTTTTREVSMFGYDAEYTNVGDLRAVCLDAETGKPSNKLLMIVNLVGAVVEEATSSTTRKPPGIVSSDGLVADSRLLGWTRSIHPLRIAYELLFRSTVAGDSESILKILQPDDPETLVYPRRHAPHSLQDRVTALKSQGVVLSGNLVSGESGRSPAVNPNAALFPPLYFLLNAMEESLWTRVYPKVGREGKRLFPAVLMRGGVGCFTSINMNHLLARKTRASGSVACFRERTGELAYLADRITKRRQIEIMRRQQYPHAPNYFTQIDVGSHYGDCEFLSGWFLHHWNHHEGGGANSPPLEPNIHGVDIALDHVRHACETVTMNRKYFGSNDVLFHHGNAKLEAHHVSAKSEMVEEWRERKLEAEENEEADTDPVLIPGVKLKELLVQSTTLSEQLGPKWFDFLARRTNADDPLDLLRRAWPSSSATSWGRNSEPLSVDSWWLNVFDKQIRAIAGGEFDRLDVVETGGDARANVVDLRVNFAKLHTVGGFDLHLQGASELLFGGCAADIMHQNRKLVRRLAEETLRRPGLCSQGDDDLDTKDYSESSPTTWGKVQSIVLTQFNQTTKVTATSVEGVKPQLKTCKPPFITRSPTNPSTPLHVRFQPADLVYFYMVCSEPTALLRAVLFFARLNQRLRREKGDMYKLGFSLVSESKFMILSPHNMLEGVIDPDSHFWDRATDLTTRNEFAPNRLKRLRSRFFSDSYFRNDSDALSTLAEKERHFPSFFTSKRAIKNQWRHMHVVHLLEMVRCVTMGITVTAVRCKSEYWLSPTTHPMDMECSEY